VGEKQAPKPKPENPKTAGIRPEPEPLPSLLQGTYFKFNNPTFSIFI
jgi:hypothetical protein